MLLFDVLFVMVDDFKMLCVMLYVCVKCKCGDVLYVCVVVEVVEVYDGFGDGVCGVNVVCVVVFVWVLDDVLDGVFDVMFEVCGVWKWWWCVRCVVEGVVWDDVEMWVVDDGAGRETRVYDVMVDLFECVWVMELVLMCNCVLMVCEYLVSWGEVNVEVGLLLFEGEEAFARTSTSASEGEDEWVYDVYEMMDEDVCDLDDDDFDDGYVLVIWVWDFYDVADDEDAESDYGDSDSNAAGYFDDYFDIESDFLEYSDWFEDDDSGFGDDDDDDWS